MRQRVELNAQVISNRVVVSSYPKYKYMVGVRRKQGDIKCKITGVFMKRWTSNVSSTIFLRFMEYK